MFLDWLSGEVILPETTVTNSKVKQFWGVRMEYTALLLGLAEIKVLVSQPDGEVLSVGLMDL